MRAADTRAAPPAQEGLCAANCTPASSRHRLLKDVDLVCISPGLSLEEEVVQAALARSIPVVGDIELFAWAEARASVLAVTGTNGKSTVTALTGHLLRSAGVDAKSRATSRRRRSKRS